MTIAQVVETSVTVNNNSPIQDYVHPDDQTQPFEYKLCPGEVAAYWRGGLDIWESLLHFHGLENWENQIPLLYNNLKLDSLSFLTLIIKLEGLFIFNQDNCQ